MNSSKTKAWRPKSITPEVVSLILSAALKWFTDEQICNCAGIGTTAYYNYKKKNPKFSERINTLKNNPTSRALANIIEEISKWNIALSKRRLDSKARREFAKFLPRDIEPAKLKTTELQKKAIEAYLEIRNKKIEKT